MARRIELVEEYLLQCVVGTRRIAKGRPDGVGMVAEGLTVEPHHGSLRQACTKSMAHEPLDGLRLLVSRMEWAAGDTEKSQRACTLGGEIVAERDERTVGLLTALHGQR